MNGFPDPSIGGARVTSLAGLSASTLAQLEQAQPKMSLLGPTMGLTAALTGAGRGRTHIPPGPAPRPAPPPITFPTPQLPPREQAAPIMGALPVIAGAAGITLPGWLLAALGVAGAGYGLYQALGGGEGGGILGINLLGGDEGFIPGTTIPLGGPGLPEPPAQMVVKEWSTGTAQFYQLIDGRIAVYSKKKRRWKVYRPQKMAVIGKKLPSHRTLVRLRHNLKRHKDDALTIIKLTAPKRLEKHTRTVYRGRIRRKY